MIIKKAILLGFAIAVPAAAITVTTIEFTAQAKHPYHFDDPLGKHPLILTFWKKEKNALTIQTISSIPFKS